MLVKTERDDATGHGVSARCRKNYFSRTMIEIKSFTRVQRRAMFCLRR
jgi:hypothetical protein